MNDRSAFDRAFVALSYVLGQRGDGLFDCLSAPSDPARRLALRLADAERRNRVAALAPELARVVAALQGKERLS